MISSDVGSNLKMGKIMHHTDNSKSDRAAVRPALILILYLVALLSIIGCGDKDIPNADSDIPDTPPPPLIVSSDPDLRPVITSDVTALNAWLDLAHQIAAVDTIDVDDVEDLFDTPAYRMITDAANQDIPSPRIIKRVMEYVFAHQDTTDAAPPRRKALLDSYLYLRDHMDEVAYFNRDHLSSERLDTLRDALVAYAPPEDLPPTISIELIAGFPLISYGVPNRFAVDVSLAIAGGDEQTAKILAGRLYQTFARVDGVRPDATEDNALKLSGTFRMLRHGAITAWLNDKPNINFDDDHGQLRGPIVGEGAMIENAILVLRHSTQTMDSMLFPLQETNITKSGDRLHTLFVRNDRYEKVGWAMAKLIVEIFGEQKLREIAGDTTGFMEAYQEAALVDGSGDALDRLPPFPSDMFEELLIHISEY
jgi:hypothetical protein